MGSSMQRLSPPTHRSLGRAKTTVEGKCFRNSLHNYVHEKAVNSRHSLAGEDELGSLVSLQSTKQ